jgi:hypothetical protein
MKILALVPILLLFACTSKPGDQEKSKYNAADSNDFTYPRQVDSLNLTDLFDSAKWYLYARSSDKYYKPQSDSSISVPLGYLELRFSSVYITHDTLILSFNYMDKDKIIMPGMTRDLAQFTTGVGFSLNTKKRIFTVFANVYYTERGNIDPTSRYFNPLQPGVLTFIRNNKDKLDPWFRAQAKRRKII